MYYRIRLEYIPHSLLNEVHELAFAHGSTGSSEVLRYIQPDLTYDPSIIESRAHHLDFYFLQEPSGDFLARVGALSEQITATTTVEQEQDWLAEWKKGFHAFALVKDFWIVPSWEDSPVTPEKTIRIDPGMAFGTGTHATTQMAAFFLKKLVQAKSLSSSQVLDVGTGTGVLAILAAKMGAFAIQGVEIDPEARRVAKENIVHNETQNVEILDIALEELHRDYDVVIANIIDGVLIELAPQLKKKTRPGGDLFVTGILTEREELFFKKFIDAFEFKVMQRLEKDEWVGFWLQHRLP